MRILAVDIGAETQDFLLYDTKKNIENSIKAVLPTPSRVYAERILNFAGSEKKSLFIKGDCIGGGKIKKAIAHAAENKKIYMTKEASRTISYKPEKVREYKIELADESNAEKSDIEIKFTESDLSLFEKFLAGFEVYGIDAVCYAVQEHGAGEGISNRAYRFKMFEKMLGKSKNLADFSITEYSGIEESSYRFKSLFKSLKKQKEKTLIMDTAHCALLGCSEDECIKNLKEYMAINFGNGHTTMAVIRNNEVLSYMEHHTRSLTDGKKLRDIIIGLADGKISNEEIYNDGGSGAITFESTGFENISKIAVTGPLRNLIKETSLDYYFACPGGDMMMTGPVGLIKSAKEKYNLN